MKTKRKRKATEKEIAWVKQWRKDNADHVKQKRRETYLANQGKIKAKSRAYRAANKEKIRKTRAAKYKKNKNAVCAVKRKKYADNPTDMLNQAKKWRINHTDVTNALSAKYHAAKMNRKPEWLTKNQIKDIQSFYRRARFLTKLTEIPHCVDHIVPLQGKLVSGLHVPWNLQILTKSENSQKHNSY